MAQRNIKEYYYIEYNMYLIFNTIPLALSHKASEREITISYNSCCCLQIISLKCRLWRLNLLIPILRWLSNWTMILSSILRSWNYGTSIKFICWIQLHSYKCQANGKAAFVFHFLCTNVTLIPVYAFFFWHGYIGIFYSIYLWMVSICGCRQNVFSILDNFHQARIALLDWMHRLSLQIFTYLWLNIFFMDFFYSSSSSFVLFCLSLYTHRLYLCIQ